MKTKMFFSLVTSTFITACSGTSDLSTEKAPWKPRIQIQAGINNGGIVENNDFSSTPNVQADAFSGATRKVGGNIGTHIVLPMKRNAFELGIDYMYNGQSFNYYNPSHEYLGTRAMGTSQFMLPITFNIGLFRQTNLKPLFYLKLGYVFQYNLLDVNDSEQNLPVYSYNKFSQGVTVGLSTIPFHFRHDAAVGMYLDAYRGSKIYNDIYNSDIYTVPGSSYYKLGLIYQFKQQR